jgi:hypothetical protein
VVTAYDDRCGTVRSGQLAEEFVVQFPRLVRRISYVKHIAGDDQYVDAFRFDGLQQPRQGRAVLGRSVTVVEAVA